MKLKARILTFLFFAAVQINAQAVDLKTRQLRQKTFEQVWSSINELYYDPTFGGIDWKKMKETYQPQAMAAQTDDEFHVVLNKMVGELKRSHLGVLSKNQIERSNTCSRENIGLELRIIDNQAIIYQIEDDSVAEKAGLKEGFAITQIDNEPISAPSQISEPSKKRIFEASVLRRLCGKPKIPVKVVALDENSVRRTFELIPESGKVVGKIGTLMREPGFESKKLDENIGFIRFNRWDPALHKQFADTMAGFLETKGIIIDLRGNRGGTRSLQRNVAAYFFDKKVSFGTFKSRNEDTDELIDPQIADYNTDGKKFTMKPVRYNYKGKLMILVDSGSASASEIFAAGMQENGRAKIVGETTMGAVLSVINKPLPTGGLLMLPLSEYKTPKQIVLEGRGVEPDISVQLTRESLLQGRDLQLEAAIKEILNK